MCASFQLIASYTSHWTWGVRFYEDSRTFSLTLLNGNEESVLAKNPEDFLLPLSTADEKCVWEKESETFLKTFSHTSLPRIWEPFGRKNGKLFWKFFCSHSPLEINCLFSRKLLNFLSSLSTGHEKCVWFPIMKNSFRYSYLEMVRVIWLRIPELCSYTSQRTWEMRLGEKIGNSFQKFLFPTHYWRRDAQVVRFAGNFSSSLTWEKCQPPLFYYPLEGKRLLERKKDAVIQIFFSLIYLDRKRSNGRKNLKIEKTALSQKRLCDRAAWCWKIHDCVI